MAEKINLTWLESLPLALTPQLAISVVTFTSNI